jgi:hypothetical protein
MCDSGENGRSCCALSKSTRRINNEIVENIKLGVFDNLHFRAQGREFGFNSDNTPLGLRFRYWKDQEFVTCWCGFFHAVGKVDHTPVQIKGAQLRHPSKLYTRATKHWCNGIPSQTFHQIGRDSQRLHRIVTMYNTFALKCNERTGESVEGLHQRE